MLSESVHTHKQIYSYAYFLDFIITYLDMIIIHSIQTNTYAYTHIYSYIHINHNIYTYINIYEHINANIQINTLIYPLHITHIRHCIGLSAEDDYEKNILHHLVLQMRDDGYFNPKVKAKDR